MQLHGLGFIVLHEHGDATHSRCDIDEEPEDEDALIQQQAAYAKTVKKTSNR